jgi:hypothetical protein
MRRKCERKSRGSANPNGGYRVMAKKYTFVVLTNPTPGKDAEYNRWYNEQHIPDVLNAAGFVCAQRFRLAETQNGPRTDQTHKYLALYEIETDDLPASLKDLASRGGTPDMIMSDAIDLKGANARIFEPVTEKVYAKDVARPRRAA